MSLRAEPLLPRAREEAGNAGLRSHLLRGTAWNYAGSLSVLVAQVGYTAATARLIAPAGFGAYAAAQACVALVGYFTLSTLGAAVMRLDHAPRDVIGTAFALSAAAGLVVAAAAAALSPLWAAAWGAPAATGLLRLFSLALLANTLAVIPLAVLRRNLRYRVAALAESTSQLAGMGIGVAAAFALRSPTALVLGQVAGSVAALAWAALAARGSLALRLDRASVRPLLGFSTQVSGQNLVYFVIYTAPSWTVAHLYGAGELGFYSRAWVIVILPLTHLAFGITKALYPLYPRVKGDAGATQELLTSTVGGAVTSTWPAFGAVAGAAPFLVSTLLGAGWEASAAVLPVLVVFGALNLPSILLSNSAEAFGWMRFVWTNQAGWVVVLGLALLSAHSLGGGTVWVAAAAAGSQALAHAAQIAYFVRRAALDVSRLSRDYALALVVAGAAFAVARELDRLPAGMSTAARLPLEAFVLSLVALALPALRFRRRLGSKLRPGIAPNPEPVAR